MFNKILIKRRTSGLAGAPGSLSGGELAFNEVDSTLYYGSSAGVISIAGSGAYVDRTTSQTIAGNKTFSGSTTLSSTTFSSSSLIDAGGNKITNLAAPSLSSDAATRQYVDDVASGASSGTASLSTEIYNTFVKLTDDRAVTLTGGLDVTSGLDADTITTTGNADIGGNLTVTGNLSVLGTQTVINTETINISGTSTQIDVVNNGTGTGITVNQTGAQDVAEFKDDGATALIIKDGGNVGIGTATPNEKLTVSGNLSASGTIYGDSGLEISSGAGATTLYVENGKVGVNTETPNEELTIVGSISASEDIYARNGTLTGTLNVGQGATLASTLSVAGAADFDSTLDVVGATTLQSTLCVTSGATFASTVSAAGAVDFDSTLDVVGATTLQSTLNVTSGATFASTVSAQGALTVDGASTLNGATTISSTLSVAGAVEFDSTLNVDGATTLGSSLTVATNLSGTANSSYIVDFIIDGGVF